MLKALHANKDLAAARKKANRVKLPAAAEVARRHDVHARPVDTDARRDDYVKPPSSCLLV